MAEGDRIYCLYHRLSCMVIRADGLGTTEPLEIPAEQKPEWSGDE